MMQKHNMVPKHKRNGFIKILVMSLPRETAKPVTTQLRLGVNRILFILWESGELRC